MMLSDKQWEYIQKQREKKRWNAYISSGANNIQSFAEYSAERTQKETKSQQKQKPSRR